MNGSLIRKWMWVWTQSLRNYVLEKTLCFETASCRWAHLPLSPKFCQKADRFLKNGRHGQKMGGDGPYAHSTFTFVGQSNSAKVHPMEFSISFPCRTSMTGYGTLVIPGLELHRCWSLLLSRHLAQVPISFCTWLDPENNRCSKYDSGTCIFKSQQRHIVLKPHSLSLSLFLTGWLPKQWRCCFLSWEAPGSLEFWLSITTH